MALRLLSRALDLVYPPRCVGCGEFGTFFCERCDSVSARASGPRCPRCWMPGREDDCVACYRYPSAYAALRSAFEYGGAPRKAVHALKFKGVFALAPTMAEPMLRLLADWEPPISAVVPVPLTGVRKRIRGYNQAELLAREIARAGGLPLETDAVRRRHQEAPQTERDELGRRMNVAKAFGMGRRPITGTVLLVDDVATTTATLDACARVLLEGGADRVYALTFARED